MVLNMKKFFIYLLSLLMCCALYGNVNAQGGLLRYADQKTEEMNYLEAAQGYEAAFNKKASYHAAKGAAIAYSKLRDYQKTYDWWKKAINYPEATSQDWLNYIGATNQADNFEAVLEALDSISNGKGEVLSNLQLDSLKYWYSQPANATMNGLDVINTSSTEFGWVNDNKGNVYFSSDRGGEYDRERRALRIDKSYKYYDKNSDWTGRDFLGIYKMDADGEVSPFEVPVPDVFHATDPHILTEQNVMFYTVTREIRKSKNYEVQSEIYFSQLDENGQPTDFKGLSINEPLSYGLKSPYLDEANQRLYFASNMPGGYGGYDIYYMEFSNGFEFGEPVNLGALINTPGNERDPFFQDGVFYFASDGHVGLGGLDLFMANVSNDGFSGLKNMGLPFNSPQDDFGVNYSGDGNLILSSNRPESKGWDDIFEMEELYKRFQALVLGCDGQLVRGELDVVLMEASERKNAQVDKDGKGKLEAELAPDTAYEMTIKKNGYFSIHDKEINTSGLSGDLLKKSYQLVRIPYKTTVYADLVYYNLNESAIRGDGETTLNKIAELLNTYSFINILVRSHTDTRASNDYNEALSEKRANAVRDYLEQYGIARSRVHAEWFGEEKLVNDCGDGVPCPEAMHQVNRRSELLLVAFPEEGKAYDLPKELEDIDLCDFDNFKLPAKVPTVYFDFNKTGLKTEEMIALEKVALMLKNMLNQRLTISGHADQRGPEEYNERLSERRALVVKEYLENTGVDSAQLDYEFFGDSNPINDCNQINCTPEMHRTNRRAELNLTASNGN